jgi:hypothetical protein
LPEDQQPATSWQRTARAATAEWSADSELQLTARSRGRRDRSCGARGTSNYCHGAGAGQPTAAGRELSHEPGAAFRFRIQSIFASGDHKREISVVDSAMVQGPNDLVRCRRPPRSSGFALGRPGYRGLAAGYRDPAGHGALPPPGGLVLHVVALTRLRLPAVRCRLSAGQFPLRGGSCSFLERHENGPVVRGSRLSASVC